MGQCSFQGNAVPVAFSLVGIPLHLAGGVHGTGSVQCHICLGTKIAESPIAEHCQQQLAYVRELEKFDPFVIANLANTGPECSLGYRPPQMGRQLSTVCPDAPPRGCSPVHCVHNYTRWVLFSDFFVTMHTIYLCTILATTTQCKLQSMLMCMCAH